VRRRDRVGAAVSAALCGRDARTHDDGRTHDDARTYNDARTHNDARTRLVDTV